MTYRDDLAALSARHAALETEVAQKRRELDETSQMLDEAKARAKLPILDNIRIASPCTADWNQMTGNERVRHCHDCKKDVFNISSMTRDEAQALIVEKAGNLCARYYQRKDGTILLADCVIGVKRKRRRRIVAVGAAALLAGGAAAGWLSRPVAEDGVPTTAGTDGSNDGAFTAGVVAIDPAQPPPPPDVHELREMKGQTVVIDKLPVAKKPAGKKSK